MLIYFKFGLLLIFILSLSVQHTQAAPPILNHNSSYDDYPDDYDYYVESETVRSAEKITLDIINPDYHSMSTSTVANTIPTTSKSKTFFSISSYSYPRSNHVLEPSCPKACLCLEEYKHILCNGAGLTQVPKDLPVTSLLLDLSENYIAELHAEDFSNITKIREINLSGNKLKTINKEVFVGLKYLQRLRLTDNQLTHIEPDAFLGTDLSELDISNNTIVLRSDGPFLTQTTLRKFACRNCSWSQIYDDTFKGLDGLQSLKLDLNDFGKKINVKAFTSLQNLIKLRLPELESAEVTELCNLLKTIDNISFRNFEISCFELVLGTSYNDSITLVTDPPYLSTEIAIVPTKVPEDTTTEATPKKGEAINKASGVQNKTAKAATSKPTNTASIVKQKEIQEGDTRMPEVNNTLGVTTTATFSVLEESANNSLTTPKILTASILGGPGDAANKVVENITVKSIVETENNHQVHISQEMVNLLLICIIIIAIVGIIIGIICRKDVGGIKTKCCRTRKPEPKDQVHPAEEIPLNKLA
ncbi:PREDICTED: slit homolog 1 protein isoform X2 [Rhagoletis zephyria]|uniref:slit homolog 1 protein isoform X2 n=1 Tax=Rhagoletis zephyria TaxID=28612 RepID=UPI0008113A03|nr:PREDICTED: slit homolog 1 protein isoform X2 [Rhagoletis zephyria]XP_017466026.1 PREDICTED: slit homolog 1 protein isoform X2 [Rhagoletis zephyria]XP_017466027.1 PREDICTED: slit homolog 1 protein isoform X2 [Rhagoletis zephyria]XP_017466028.1 PREDICTED: slit homolog 1 protein isoform X2 [Rhagoletis zephyria]XP_017466029.1 PREDICTED: slit homolog 1 protein isoform X2 [Rhagoletis zephyria]XP_017466030.1 PREDICTED: slit homolog 1 protein isoform X2 [Rhagoletis zephyria]XP_017466031.1 PREDICTE